MQLDWISAAIGIASLVLSAFIAAITASWTIASRLPTREELNNVNKGLNTRLDKGVHDVGETVAAIRQKVERVELWVRDEYAVKEDVRAIQKDILTRLNAEVLDNRRRLEQLPAVVVKVDTLWSFVIDRGRLEAMDKGFMQKNSPLMLTETGMKAVRPILPAVAEYCSHHPEFAQMNEKELASILIEQFEEKLLEEVCEPSNIFLGACIVMLIEALKQTNVIGSGPKPAWDGWAAVKH